jgi:hypothetical protein
MIARRRKAKSQRVRQSFEGHARRLSVEEGRWKSTTMARVSVNGQERVQQAMHGWLTTTESRGALQQILVLHWRVWADSK